MPTAPNLMGTYLVKGSAGDTANPSAPILSFALVANDASGQVSGQAQVSQELVEYNVGSVTGHIQKARGLGNVTKFVALQGNAIFPYEPPLLGSFALPFQAHFMILDDSWDGTGSWTLGSQAVNNVQVRSSVSGVPEA
jgi:hypothetical protein